MVAGRNLDKISNDIQQTKPTLPPGPQPDFLLQALKEVQGRTTKWKPAPPVAAPPPSSTEKIEVSDLTPAEPVEAPIPNLDNEAIVHPEIPNDPHEAMTPDADIEFSELFDSEEEFSIETPIIDEVPLPEPHNGASTFLDEAEPTSAVVETAEIADSESVVEEVKFDETPSFDEASRFEEQPIFDNPQQDDDSLAVEASSSLTDAPQNDESANAFQQPERPAWLTDQIFSVAEKVWQKSSDAAPSGTTPIPEDEKNASAALPDTPQESNVQSIQSKQFDKIEEGFVFEDLDEAEETIPQPDDDGFVFDEHSDEDFENIFTPERTNSFLTKATEDSEEQQVSDEEFLEDEFSDEFEDEFDDDEENDFPKSVAPSEQPLHIEEEFEVEDEFDDDDEEFDDDFSDEEGFEEEFDDDEEVYDEEFDDDQELYDEEFEDEFDDDDEDFENEDFGNSDPETDEPEINEEESNADADEFNDLFNSYKSTAEPPNQSSFFSKDSDVLKVESRASETTAKDLDIQDDELETYTKGSSKAKYWLIAAAVALAGTGELLQPFQTMKSVFDSDENSAEDQQQEPEITEHTLDVEQPQEVVKKVDTEAATPPPVETAKKTTKIRKTKRSTQKTKQRLAKTPSRKKADKRSTPTRREKTTSKAKIVAKNRVKPQRKKDPKYKVAPSKLSEQRRKSAEELNEETYVNSDVAVIFSQPNPSPDQTEYQDPRPIENINMTQLSTKAFEGKLEKQDRDTLMKIMPRDSRYNKANAALLMDSQQRSAEHEIGLVLIRIMEIPENRTNPVYLATKAHHQVNMGRYIQAGQTIQKARSSWSDMPSHLQKPMNAELMEVEAAASLGAFYQKPNDQKLKVKAIELLKNCLRHAKTIKDKEMAKRAQGHLNKLRMTSQVNS